MELKLNKYQAEALKKLLIENKTFRRGFNRVALDPVIEKLKGDSE